MKYRILGPLEVEGEAGTVSLGGQKQRALLAVLLLHPNEVVSRDRLVDELWGGSPPETASTALQVHVSQLRKALGRDVIVTQPPGYLIRVEPGELDLQRFEKLVDEARGAEAAVAAERLRDALRLWRGAPLAELDSVARSERARLEEQRLSALEQRIEADLELGRHADLVPELEGLVREHPLRERLRGQLMLAPYRSGRRLLDEELGLEPGDELKRLERAILEQDPSLAAGAGSPQVEPMLAAVPTGTVTFLFTDIEGSTRLVRELGDEYGAVLEQHHRLVRERLQAHGGQEIDNQGDAFFFAFRRARDAVRAAVEAQKAFASAQWPKGAAVHIRVGVHTGEPGLAETGYHGLDVVRAARISGCAHGRQILVSSATRDLVGAALEDVAFQDVGEHRLKDLEQPQRIFQVLATGIPVDFPPPRTEDAAGVMAIGGREEELAVAAEAALGAEEKRLRRFRRSRVAAVAGALLLAGAIAGVVVALTGGSSAPVAVLPNSAAVVDPETKKVVADVPIGGRPVSIAVGVGAVWVGNGDDGTVSRIDPETYEVVKTIGLGVEVSDIAVGHGSVWVAGGNAGTLTRIDPRLDAVQATIDFEQPARVIARPVFHVATDRNSVWVTESDRLVKIDPRTEEVISRLPLGPAPLGLAAGSGNVFVTTLDERLLRIDARSVDVTAALDLPAQGLFPLVSRGRLWLLVAPPPFERRPSQVWRVDPATMTQTGTATFPSAYLWQLAAGNGGLWSADFDTGGLLRVDPATVRLARVVPLRPFVSAMAAGYGLVWIGIEKQFS
jgi:DNA-binding SARP family transcriptional activator/streptogramin lyase